MTDFNIILLPVESPVFTQEKRMGHKIRAPSIIFEYEHSFSV